jgi:hypothetical protein
MQAENLSQNSVKSDTQKQVVRILTTLSALLHHLSQDEPERGGLGVDMA